ncbi:hypothetical protein JCM33774_20300 [Actinophytocola sp. KF-1]
MRPGHLSTGDGTDTAVTATGVLTRAVTWFAEHDVTVERVLSDNGSCYRSHTWRNTCTDLGMGVMPAR